MVNVVVLTGAGISAESGLKTFRDSGGLWENYSVYDVATPEAWYKNPKLVLDFYNERRKQAAQAQPNLAHKLISELQTSYNTWVITQNVDDLHERSGSRNVLHLHGELNKARSTKDSSLIYPIEGSYLNIGDKCEKGSQLRPHIVWFGEPVPAMEQAIDLLSRADILLIVGTSLQVYPAAGLLELAPAGCKRFVVDPGTFDVEFDADITHIQKIASEGVKDFMNLIKDDAYEW